MRNTVISDYVLLIAQKLLLRNSYVALNVQLEARDVAPDKQGQVLFWLF